MPPTPLPHPFAEDTYAAWHDATFTADKPMRDNVQKLRSDLMANARGQLTDLAQILTYAVNYSRNEYQQSTKNTTNYNVALSDALMAKPGSTAYELLFKSTSSIINKLWRKDKRDVPDVSLANVRERITDLVRTDVSATTLHSANFLATRMNALPEIIYEPSVRKAFGDAIASIRFEPEMKMESGYFAYHGLVHFKSGLIVEVQIYSELMRQWRHLSHHHYERARIEGMQKHEFNSEESRLVSLGHLLHLAECQLLQLVQEFGGH